MKTSIFIGSILVLLTHSQAANVNMALSSLVRREIDSALNSCTWASCTDNSTQLLIEKLDDINAKLDTLQQRLNACCLLGSNQDRSASSCAEILEENPDASSGYYWVSNATGHTHRVYCDMTRSCGGVTGGWMRVAYLNMTNSSHQCPSSLYQRTDSGVRSCAVKTHSASCSSVWYLPQGIPYSRVCGRVLGHFILSPAGFRDTQNINSNYVDGVSLTYGNTNRHHIWSFASTYIQGSNQCRCGDPPSFVKSHYFCDAHQVWSTNVDNPLWDGEGCGSNNCCTLHNPPWFYRHLPQTTTEDIEMRLCRDEERHNEDVTVQTVEIYVQ